MAGATTTPQRRNHDRRNQTGPTRDHLIRDTARLLDGCGISRSPSWTSRTVAAYLRHAEPKGFPFGPWLAAQLQLNAQQRAALSRDPELRYVLIYRDPVGELAVNRVLRGVRASALVGGADDAR